MASTLLTDISTALSLLFRAKLTTSINGVAVLPFLLPVEPGSGKNLSWTVEFTGATDAVASTEGAARSSSDADDESEQPATLNWAQYDKTSSVTTLAQAAAGSNFNPESIGAMGNDLLLGRMLSQLRRLGLGIASDMYAGDETATPIELAGAARVIDSSNTIAGIAPGSFSEWAGVETTGPLANVSFSQIQAFLLSIYEASGFYPEFCTCPPTVFSAIKALYTDYEAHVVREIVLNRGGGAAGDEPRTVKMSSGMKAIEIDQVPIVMDRHATANTLYAWNTDFVTIRQLDPVKSVLDQGEKGILDLFRRLADKPRLTLPRGHIEGMTAKHSGLKPNIDLLGKRGLSVEANVNVFAQMEYKRRNTFGKIVFT